MKVSVIGTGKMGKGIVKTLDSKVGNLYWSSRDIEKVTILAQELNLISATSVSTLEALHADIIIPTLWFKDLIPWAIENKQLLAGKILIDIVNPFTEDFNDFSIDWGTSASEELQNTIPDTTIVGAFKNTFYKVFDQPIYDNLSSDVYVTSDDQNKKEIVMNLLKSTPFRVLDGGNLKNNRTIERITLFERELSMRYGSYPYVSNRIFGLENIRK
jgi:predicted dinucleotide-binding enzyme